MSLTDIAVAHRGGAGLAPENTLAAVHRALAGGADVVEIDVHRTRDGELVVLHDADVRRTTDAATALPGRESYAVADLTLADVRRLDAGSWKDARFAGERVPTLAEVVDVVARAGAAR